KALSPIAVIALAVASLLVEDVAAAAKPHPNLLLIVIDNVGYGDLGCFGNTEIRTPHMDRLAAEGTRLTQFYCGSPSCTPSRGAILTGRHPVRNGLNWQLKAEEQLGIGLALDERIIPSFLKPLGYATGAFGKWNIGFGPGGRPTERGFDEYFGHASGNIDYYRHLYNGRLDTYRGIENVRVEGYSTDLFADAACDFIRAHANSHDPVNANAHIDAPWFVYLPFNAAHVPNPKNTPPGDKTEWQVPSKYLEMYGWRADEPDNVRRYAAVMTALDAAIGRVLKTVDDLGEREETFVFLMSDNGAHPKDQPVGPEGSNGPLRGGITQCWEGGIRVPAMARWPGNIPAGSTCEAMLWAMDILPTFVAAAGGTIPDGWILDGADVRPALMGAKMMPREFFWQFRKFSAVRSADWKLVRSKETGPWELFDLVHDIGESHDVAAEHPKVVDELAGHFKDWLTTTAR
ncbi:MAG TPA: sulfatase-like hydrolase/transferase, partial [Pirellulales bacterium]|nr:sulfatase-like hydrolase/transferase [Pirellulales bacterium]